MNGWIIIILIGLVTQVGGIVCFMIGTRVLHRTTIRSPKEIRCKSDVTGEILYTYTLNSMEERDWKLVTREVANTIRENGEK